MPDEQDISQFLTIDGQVFIAAEYKIAFEKRYNEGESCPDFVALDFRRKDVVVVEVSSAWDLNSLLRRVEEREARWFRPLRRALRKRGIINDKWKMRVLAFIRESRMERANSKFTNEADVTFFEIEKASFPWLYWDDRIKYGLPDRGYPR